MARRAKFEKTVVTARDRVREFMANNPEVHRAQDIAKATGASVFTVYAVKKKQKKAGSTTTDEGSSSLPSEKDILAVAKIGIEKCERVIRLLRALRAP